MNDSFINNYIRFTDKISAGALCNGNKENMLISPYSLLTLLAMLSEAADTDSYEEIRRLIGTDCTENEFRAGLKELYDKLKAVEGVEFSSANAFSVKELFAKAVKTEFMELIRNEYEADVFASSANQKELNTWVEEKTKGLIKRTIDGETDLSLINATVFIAGWRDIYEDDCIFEGEEFTNAFGQKEKAAMLFSGEEIILENDDFIGFAKPYRNISFSFAAIIPKDKNRIADGALGVKKICELFRNLEWGTIEVYMPEFKFDFDLDVAKNLKELGVRSIFDRDDADLSRMIDLPDSYVRDVLHKIHIEVDRLGTKAAAYSEAIFELGRGSRFDEIKEVRLDRPFTFAIMHNVTGLPIFIGVVNSVN